MNSKWMAVAAVLAVSWAAGTALADPLAGEIPKFVQKPMVAMCVVLERVVVGPGWSPTRPSFPPAFRPGVTPPSCRARLLNPAGKTVAYGCGLGSWCSSWL